MRAVRSSCILVAILVLTGAVWSLWSKESAHDCDLADETPTRVPIVHGDPPRLPPPQLQWRAPRSEDPSAPSTAASGSLLLRVRWSDGTAAQGVVASVLLDTVPNCDTFPVELRTDASGTALANDLAPGHAEIELDRCPATDAEIRAGERTVCDVTVPRGLDVELCVLGESDAPIRGASVWLARANPLLCGLYASWCEGNVIGTTDDAGRVTLRDVGLRRMIAVRAPGFWPSRAFLEAEGVAAKPGDRLRITRRIAHAGGCVEATILDPEGKPCPRAVAQVAYPDRPDEYRFEYPLVNPRFLLGHVPRVVVRADDSGTVRLDGLRPDFAHLIWCRGPDTAVTREAFQVETGQTTRIRLSLSKAARILGTVRDEEGVQLLGALVQSDRKGAWADPLYSFQRCRCYTQLDGEYRLVGVSPGKLELRVDCPGFLQRALDVDVIEAADIALDVRLSRAPRSESIRGRLLDENDKPLPSWHVELVPSAPAQPARRLRTDSLGRFAADRCSEDEYRLRMFAPDSQNRVFPVLVQEHLRRGDTEVFLRVPRWSLQGGIRGRLLGADNVPLGAVEIHVLDTVTRESARFVTAADGSYVVGPLPSGAYKLTVGNDAQEAVLAASVTIVTGQRLDLGTVRLAR